MPTFFTGRRGEYADRPLAIPRRGWWQVLKRVASELGNDRISIISAGISYYSLLSIFPAIAMLIMVYGLVSDAETARGHVALLSGILPEEAYTILAEQLTRVSSTATGSLGFGLLLSFVLAAWGASRAVTALMIAMNVAYDEEERRGIITQNLVALGLTLGGLCFFALSVTAIAAVPAAIAFLDLGGALTAVLAVVQWTALGVAAILALAGVYRFAPCRASARLRWLTPGAVVATLLWLLGSLLFSFYVANFASYNETFGSLGAVVVLLLWFYLSAFAVCVGAEINSELERQTFRDTTTGPDRPIGRRGAVVADEVAQPHE